MVAQQLMRAIRGARSQVAFARRLGYRGNPITDWERGTSYPTAQEMLRACERVGVDTHRALQRFANVPIEAEHGQHAVGAWLRAVAGVSPTELARRVGRSRSSVSRWLSGAAQPRLPEFLHLVDAATGRVPDLVAELVPIAQVPVLHERHEAGLAAKRLAFDAPWTEAVLRLLETRGYMQSAGETDWLAAVLGIEVGEVARCLQLLETAGLVRRSGRRWIHVGGLSVDTRGGKDALHALKSHWANVAADRARTPQRGDMHAYNMVSVSSADLDRIQELLHKTFREVRAIVAASEPAEQVALVNLQLLRWSTELE